MVCYITGGGNEHPNAIGYPYDLKMHVIVVFSSLTMPRHGLFYYVFSLVKRISMFSHTVAQEDDVRVIVLPHVLRRFQACIGFYS